MPVALTERIGRSQDQQLLRSRIGLVQSWVLDDKDTITFSNRKRVLKHLPKVMFVKFLLANGVECKWQVDGASESGLCPIVPPQRAIGFWAKVASIRF